MAAKKILIVDDEEDVRLFLGDFLSERDLQVSTAASGEEALQKMEKSPADVVLLDIMMPGIDGLECLKLIREKYPKTAVIMLTALKDEARIAKANKLGALNYIIKPFSLDYLEKELVKLMNESPSR